MEERLNTLGRMLASRSRRNILMALENSLSTPTKISMDKNMPMSSVSRILGELMKLHLVECKTPNLRKGRLYSLTSKGKQVLEDIKKLKY
jgi:predicted transcriptional regulator